MKYCPDCKETKELTQFHKNKARHDKYCNYCIDCNKKKKAIRYSNNSEEILRKNRAHYYNSRPERQKKIRSTNLTTKYGITDKDYETMFFSQGGVCAACGKPETATNTYSGGKRRLAVDHDHRAGNVRGLLCMNCNRALGHLQDSPENTLNLYKYISRFN